MHVQSFSCHLQRRDRLGAIDSGEVDQELIKGISRFEIVEEVLHRDARGNEYRHSAQDLGIPVYDWFFHSFPSVVRDGASEQPYLNSREGDSLSTDRPTRSRPRASGVPHPAGHDEHPRKTARRHRVVRSIRSYLSSFTTVPVAFL